MQTRSFAIAAAAIAAPLGLMQSAIWNGPAAPWLARVVGAWFAPNLPGVVDPPPPIYFATGRGFIVVYLLLALALGSRAQLGRAARSLLLGALAVAALGDFGAYWLSDQLGVAFRKVAFWQVELPALGVALFATTARGIFGLRWGERRSAWALTFALPVALVCTALLRYMPHGPALGLALVLATGRPATRSVRRTALVAVACLGALLAFGWTLRYRANAIAGAVPMSAEPLTQRCAGLSLHVFNTGFNRMSPLLAPPPRPWRPVPAFAIVHPRAGVLAFDTGLSDATARRGEAAMAWPARWLLESRGDPRRRFDVQLREAGLAPPRTIVHSHLHEDHTGTSALFSKATVLSAHPFDRPGPRPFERNFDLFGDGCVRLIPGGGHTHEDVMALLALPQGPVLLAGDAVVHFDWLGAQDVERIAVDPERAATVRNQVRAFAGVIFPGHDLRRAPRDRADIVLHHPEWFERGAWKP